MRVMALFSTSFFAKYLRRCEDGPGQGHLCHTDTLVFLFYHGIVCCVYSLELPHQGDSNEYTQHTIIV